MAKVLVTDGRSRASLAIVRSLGKKGIRVVSGEAFSCSSFYSKYSERLLYPPPDKQPDLFVEKMLDLVKNGEYDTIIPVRDDVTLLLSKNKDIFSKFINIPVADYDTLWIGRDKAQTIKAALSNDVPCPKTYFPSDPDDLQRFQDDLEYPAVIKPHESSGSRGIKMVHSFGELLIEYKKVYSDFGPAMVQEFIPYGGAYGVSMLFNKGEPRAIFTHKRIREYPASGGPSILRESVRYPEIEEHATRLLKKLNWHGVAMVEFRIDSRNNEPKLMEINPRFWGSLQLAVYSGVDFPYMLYQMAMKGDVEPVMEYETGRKVRWLLFGDILWFINSSNKLKDFREFKKFSGVGYDILSLDDPMPTIGTLIYGLKSFFLKERRKHVFNRGW
ncbi:MAG: ATP-grasp domain-containing protein [Methanosarcinales archaeon]|nr:ATP-grasp domain-containing protein [Methanosarcinales archaeon]